MAFPSDYTKYQEVTIDATKVTADQTDFVVYVDLAELVKAGADIFDTCRTDGGDIRATKTDGTTELPIEIVAIDTTGKTGEVHIKFTGTLSSSTDTVIRLWYNGTDTLPAVTATYGRNNVWTGYVMVQHMQGANALANDDSSSNGNDVATSTGSPLYSQTGKLSGKAIGFVSASQESLGIPDSVSLSPSAGLQVSLWAKPTGDGHTLVSKRNNPNYAWELNNEKSFYKMRINDNSNDANSTTAPSIGTWRHIVGSYDKDLGSANIKMFVNGTQEGSRSYTTALNDTAVQVDIGRRSYSGAENYADASIDEVRIASAPKATGWISTEYNNQNAPDTFSTAGDEQTSSSGTDYPITASVGAFTLTGVITALQIGLQLIASVGTFALTGITTGLKFGKTLIANTGTFVLTGIEAVLIAGGRLSAEVGTFVLTGIDATLAIPRRFLAEVGEFTLTGIDITFQSGKGMIASVGTFALTGFDAIFGLGKGMVTSVGNFTLTGFTVTFDWVKRITAGVGSFILTGINAILRPSNIWSNPSDKNNADWVNKDKS